MILETQWYFSLTLEIRSFCKVKVLLAGKGAGEEEEILFFFEEALRILRHFHALLFSIYLLQR